jgi:hypothetical protein
MSGHEMETMTMDIISQTLQLIGFLFSLVVLALLWRKAFRRSEFPLFWRLLAAAWTLGMLGTIAWIIHDLVTGTELDTFSAVDVFYVSRYVLLGCVLWLYPAPLPRRDGLWIGGAVLAGSAIACVVYFDAAMALMVGGWADFLGLVMYLILDAGIVMLAWLRVRATRGSAWSRYALLLFGSMISYGIANTINLTEYVFSLTSGGILQNLLWILADVFALVLVLTADPQTENKGLIRDET